MDFDDLIRLWLELLQTQPDVAELFRQRFELPLGALTAIVGAPYFLAALRANEGRG